MLENDNQRLYHENNQLSTVIISIFIYLFLMIDVLF